MYTLSLSQHPAQSQYPVMFFCAEHYFWRSDWLTRSGDGQARSLYSVTLLQLPSFSSSDIYDQCSSLLIFLVCKEGKKAFYIYKYFVGLSLTLGKVTQISKGTSVKWDNKACKIYSTEKVTYQFYCVSNFLSSNVIRHWCISDSYDKKGVCHSFCSKESFWNESLLSSTICVAVVSTIQVFFIVFNAGSFYN